MEFNVVGLLKEGIGETREYEIEQGEVLLRDEGTRAPVSGHVKLTRTNDGILAETDLTLEVEEECARCTSSFKTSMPVRIEEIYYPTIDIDSGRRLPAQDDPEAFLIDEHHILDLSEPIRQYRWIAEDLAPLCRPECKGLCAVCGVDLNQESQHKHEAPVDARWSALAELAGRMDKE
ncbi:MAG TPA: DUF177 domain-containing protein [Dehalococcoidia bacterium]|nr:DUF177 domain-containing protein [Dehalococcoidia bacterium]